MLNLGLDQPGPVSLLEEAVIGQVSSLAGTKDRKMFVLVGDGSQALLRKETQEPIPCGEGALSDPGKENIVCIRRGKVSVYIVPAGLEVEPRNAVKVKQY